MNERSNSILHIRKLLSQSNSVENQMDQETARVLRGRLILFGVLACITAVYAVVAGAMEAASRQWLITNVGLAALLIAVYAPISVLLVRRGTWPLNRLRFIEALFFAAACLFVAAWEYVWFHHGYVKNMAMAGQETNLMELTGDALAFPWFTLIVFYGVCIPNTGRRCAGAVALMCFCAVLSVVAFNIETHPLRDFLFRDTLREMAFWLAIAAAIAIYGSQKSTELRREITKARQLGQYVLGEKLGMGGMGEVYWAEHNLLRRPCAIKLIRPEKAGDEDTLQRFEREVQATAALTGGNVVDIYDFGYTPDGTFFYVMEYLPGMNLQEFVDRHGPMLPERAVHILRQVCWALHEAHAAGLIHRDIKPSNIYLCERGKVHDVAKLLDFGLVQGGSHTEPVKGNMVSPPLSHELATPLTRTDSVVGTPNFMSPEQLKGELLDGRTDLYSLGITAYFLMTGKNPFGGSTFADIAKAHLEQEPPSLVRVCPTVDVDLNAVVMRCLEKSRDARYPDAFHLQEALGRCRCADRWTFAKAEAWWSQN